MNNQNPMFSGMTNPQGNYGQGMNYQHANNVNTTNMNAGQGGMMGGMGQQNMTTNTQMNVPQGNMMGNMMNQQQQMGSNVSTNPSTGMNLGQGMGQNMQMNLQQGNMMGSNQPQNKFTTFSQQMVQPNSANMTHQGMNNPQMTTNVMMTAQGNQVPQMMPIPQMQPQPTTTTTTTTILDPSQVGTSNLFAQRMMGMMSGGDDSTPPTNPIVHKVHFGVPRSGYNTGFICDECGANHKGGKSFFHCSDRECGNSYDLCVGCFVLKSEPHKHILKLYSGKIQLKGTSYSAVHKTCHHCNETFDGGKEGWFTSNSDKSLKFCPECYQNLLHSGDIRMSKYIHEKKKVIIPSSSSDSDSSDVDDTESSSDSSDYEE